MNKKVLLAISIVALFFIGIGTGILIYMNNLAKNKPEAVLNEFIEFFKKLSLQGHLPSPLGSFSLTWS